MDEILLWHFEVINKLNGFTFSVFRRYICKVV